VSILLEQHIALTGVRAQAYADLFGGPPSTVLPPHALHEKPDERFLIDIFVYPLKAGTSDIEVAVTNGMSDQRMVRPDYPSEWYRRELIQYFPKCTERHARRLYDMALLPLFDEFYLDCQQSVAWGHPAVEGTPWKNAFFLLPPIQSHQEDVCEVEGDKVSLLWHVPISDEELAFKHEHGNAALIDRMDAVSLPWIFDEQHRPPLVG
jgi:hypothetical protein